MTEHKYSFQDKMNSSEPEELIISGKVKYSEEEAIAYLDNMDAKGAINSVVNYLSNYKNDLLELYNWEFSLDKLGFISGSDMEKLKAIPDGDNYERNIALKAILPNYLIEGHYSYEKAIDWIIQEWGGIKTGGKITKNHKQELENSKVTKALAFDRIASLSKVAAFMSPEQCIIYDSRVAYSLNWILLSAGVKHRYLPIPEGRNSKMKAFDMNILIHLAHKKSYVSANPTKENKQFISQRDKNIYIYKNRAYYELNSLIKEVSKELWKGDSEKQKNLFYTEMLLFSIADTHIIQDIIKRATLQID